MAPMIRVLLAEDHPMFRDGLAALLSGLPDVDIIASVDTVADLEAAVEQLHPDVAVVDLALADGSALPALSRLRATAPGCGLLVLTNSDDDDSLDAALRAGARGYLLKSALPEEIARAVRTVHSGDGVYDGAVIERLTRYLNTPSHSTSAAIFPRLTEREREVLSLMARGMSNAQIADSFVLSLKTVRNHVSNVLTKLGVPSRAEAIVLAREAGLGTRP
jgi:DNA-binding NarL/FixJ family response regulator